MLNWKTDPEKALCAMGEIEGDVWFEEQLMPSGSFNDAIRKLKWLPFVTILGFGGCHHYHLFADGRIEFAWIRRRPNTNLHRILELFGKKPLWSTGK